MNSSCSNATSLLEGLSRATSHRLCRRAVHSIWLSTVAHVQLIDFKFPLLAAAATTFIHHRLHALPSTNPLNATKSTLSTIMSLKHQDVFVTGENPGACESAPTTEMSLGGREHTAALFCFSIQEMCPSSCASIRTGVKSNTGNGLCDVADVEGTPCLSASRMQRVDRKVIDWTSSSTGLVYGVGYLQPISPGTRTLTPSSVIPVPSIPSNTSAILSSKRRTPYTLPS